MIIMTFFSKWAFKDLSVQFCISKKTSRETVVDLVTVAGTDLGGMHSRTEH